MNIEAQVLYEDNHLIIVNKLAGQLIQGDKSGDTPLLELIKHYLKVKYNKPGEVFLGLVHRLDRPVSGVVVFAKTSKALSRMNELFKQQKVSKIYWAIVSKMPKENRGTLVDFLKKNERNNKSYVVSAKTKSALRAELVYKLLASSNKYFLLEVVLKTGRHHQIRVQLSNKGMTIKGDLKYGAARSNDDASISLHARSLSFVHPVSKEKIEVVAKVPDDTLWKYFEESQQ
ncbi:MAG: RluA family pseudouridine synthase [Bacteroidales bacterium]|jgi:23S rRNA pseudouridine1911/1915/1917 synthase|nr:RluA family pseudouridine synthase [Bacteroidales bacterium]